MINFWGSVHTLSLEEEQEAKFNYYLKAIDSETNYGVTDHSIKNVLKIVKEISQSLREDKLTTRQSEDLQATIESNIKNMRTHMYATNLTRFLSDIEVMNGEFEGEFGKLTKPERIDTVVKEARVYGERGWLDFDSLKAIEVASKAS